MADRDSERSWQMLMERMAGMDTKLQRLVDDGQTASAERQETNRQVRRLFVELRETKQAAATAREAAEKAPETATETATEGLRKHREEEHGLTSANYNPWIASTVTQLYHARGKLCILLLTLAMYWWPDLKAAASALTKLVTP